MDWAAWEKSLSDPKLQKNPFYQAWVRSAPRIDAAALQKFTEIYDRCPVRQLTAAELQEFEDSLP